MEQQIKNKEKLKHELLKPKPLPKPTVQQKNNNNHYIKQYAAKLQTLYEAGFIDIERNLYLLITFNGNLDTVINKLLGFE